VPDAALFAVKEYPMAHKMTRKMATETLRRENEALIDEMSRFNAALARGAHVVFHAKAGDHRVVGVEAGGWYVCRTTEGQTLKFKGEPNSIWADLLRQAGVNRHPCFA
jgi:hypothetical protein